MQKKKRRVLSVILSALLLISIIPLTASAIAVVDSGTCGDNLTWTLDSEGILTISGNGAMYDFNYSGSPWHTQKNLIKELIFDGDITNVGAMAFSHCVNIVNIRFPDTLRYIGYSAFYGCESLVDINLPDSLEYISDEAFYYCEKLSYVSIPYPLIIGNSAFYGCAFTPDTTTYGEYYEIDGVIYNKTENSIIKYPTDRTDEDFVIPDGINKISTGAFSGCSALKNIVIPDSVTDIEENAFNGTGYYDNPDNWHDGVLYIGSCLIKADSSVVSGEYTVKNGTKVIADSAFDFCDNLTSVAVPDGTLVVGDWAFAYCYSLENVILPNSLTKIGIDAFSQTAYLESSENYENGMLYNGTNLINAQASGECVVNYGTTLIAAQAFSYSEVTKITLPETVKHIGAMAFSECHNLLGVNIPENVTVIERGTFEYSGIKSIELHNKITSIGNNAFGACQNLEEIIIPDSVKFIEDYAFGGCSGLQHISIPEGITILNKYSFEACENIKSISLPKSLTLIRCKTFLNTIFEEIHFNGTEDQWNSIYKDDFDYSDSVIYFKDCSHKNKETQPEIGATCNADGITESIICIDCGKTLVPQKIIPATGHKDNDDNNICDNCGVGVCDHMCHKSGIMGFFWEIINFFQMLFGINPVCECGVAHY